MLIKHRMTISLIIHYTSKKKKTFAVSSEREGILPDTS